MEDHISKSRRAVEEIEPRAPTNEELVDRAATAVASADVRRVMGAKAVASPALLFDSLACNIIPCLCENFEKSFDVVALPGESLDDAPQPGDIVVVRALAEGDLALAEVIVEECPESEADLHARVVPLDESSGPTKVRRLTDSFGRLDHSTLILRPIRESRTVHGPLDSEGHILPCKGEGTAAIQAHWWDTELAVEASSELAPPDLRRLLRYHVVSFATFAPFEGRYFDALTRHLRLNGVLSPTETVGRSSYERAVRQFQRANGLSADGLPGADTLWQLQASFAAGQNLRVRRVPADLHPGSGGFDRFRLREDVADAYTGFRAEVLAAGGRVTSAGSLRDLGAALTPGRSATSMHFSGLALDLATDTGMRNPDRDLYLITSEGRRWRVWCRSESATEQTLDVVVWRRGRTSTRQITARACDLTAMAERHGFARIGRRRSFPGNYLSAEWWHFQYEVALVPFFSQFGIELLKLYDDAALRRNPRIWSNRKRVFKSRRRGRGWF